MSNEIARPGRLSHNPSLSMRLVFQEYRKPALEFRIVFHILICICAEIFWLIHITHYIYLFGFIFTYLTLTFNNFVLPLLTHSNTNFIDTFKQCIRFVFALFYVKYTSIKEAECGQNGLVNNHHSVYGVYSLNLPHRFIQLWCFNTHLIYLSLIRFVIIYQNKLAGIIFFCQSSPRHQLHLNFPGSQLTRGNVVGFLSLYKYFMSKFTDNVHRFDWKCHYD